MAPSEGGNTPFLCLYDDLADLDGLNEDVSVLDFIPTLAGTNLSETPYASRSFGPGILSICDRRDDIGKCVSVL